MQHQVASTKSAANLLSKQEQMLSILRSQEYNVESDS